MHEVMRHLLDAAVNLLPAFVTAFKSPTVNKKKVAEQLESKYCATVTVYDMIEFTNSSTKVKRQGIYLLHWLYLIESVCF